MTALVLIRPDRESAASRRLAAEALKCAKGTQFAVTKTFRGARAQVVGEPWIKPVQFLSPADAQRLYEILHTRTALVAFAQFFVRRDPTCHPVTRKKAIDVQTFVQHKSEFVLVRGHKDLESAMAGFEAKRVACCGDSDPRCLPLHVFAVDRDWTSLADAAGRRQFEQRHGPLGARLDVERRRWTRADRRAFHGAPELTVAGYRLPRGMHWDVTSERGQTNVVTANEVWRLPAAGDGYLNIYPNGHVRGGQGRAARQIWPKRHRV